MMSSRCYIGVVCSALMFTLTTSTTLFASSYVGSVTTLSLTPSLNGYSLRKTSQNSNCAPSPSWLTLDFSQKVLYCIDEGLAVPNGSLNSFNVHADGSLDLIKRTSTISGPVSSVIYGSSVFGKGIAVAHYAGGTVSSWTLNSTTPGEFMLNQNLPQPLDETGPNIGRQGAPHEHQAITDPTGQYVLVPDLGSDRIRVFAIDSRTLQLDAQTSLKMTPGSGPRHAAFSCLRSATCKDCTSFLYVVAELSNTVTGFAVTYLATGGMAFRQIWDGSVYGPLTVPSGSAPAEIFVSLDGRFIHISNRNDKSFSITRADGSTISSDSISTFELHDDGTAEFLQLTPAGGNVPRQFSMNEDGNLVAVGLQGSGEVVILERNVTTGMIGKQVAEIDVEGGITSVVWWESSKGG